MKTVNKNNVCDTFIHDLNTINNYIKKCKEVFRDEDLYLSFSYEYAILQTYKAFEYFVMRILIACLNHDHSCFEEKYGIALGKHINDDVCEFLITKGGYFDFRGYSGLISALKGNLGDNSKLASILKENGEYRECIEQLCAARNYAAHNSKQSKETAKKAFNIKQISSAGSCLKQQNRLQNIINVLIHLSNNVKNHDIY